MNDLESQIRDTLRRHEHDVPSFDPSDAERAAGRTRRRQILNVVSLGFGSLVVVIGLFAGVGELLRAERPSTVIDRPPSVTTPRPGEAGNVNGWPGARVEPAGVYSWDAQGAAWMHNVSHGASGVEIEFVLKGEEARRLWPASDAVHGEATAVTIAGHDATHWQIDARREEWVVDIEGTTFSILLRARPGSTDAEQTAAHAVIESIRKGPQAEDPGFILTFTLPSGWDSG